MLPQWRVTRWPLDAIDRLDRAVDIGRMLTLNKDATGTRAKNER
jgi:hypothetical protein